MPIRSLNRYNFEIKNKKEEKQKDLIIY